MEYRIKIFGSLSEKDGYRVMDWLDYHRLPDTEATYTVILMSHGGATMASDLLTPILREAKESVGYNALYARSAAACILAACKTRYAHRECETMIHPSFFLSDGGCIDRHLTERLARKFSDERAEDFELFSTIPGIKPAFLEQIAYTYASGKDFIFSAAEGLDYGFYTGYSTLPKRPLKAIPEAPVKKKTKNVEQEQVPNEDEDDRTLVLGDYYYSEEDAG